jgi:hypothetical protein
MTLREIAFRTLSPILAKAHAYLLLYPCHKWDGNEFKAIFSFIAVPEPSGRMN